jgi:hypothetical protein
VIALIRLLLTAVLLFPVLLFGASAFACDVTQKTVVPLTIVGTSVLVPVAVNGVEGMFILDTGAVYTVVTPDAVDRFKLALDEWTSTTMRGVGGVERRRNADPRSFELGGVPLHRRSLARDATLRVVTMPINVIGGKRVDGLLGRDFLSSFDLDLDFPGRTLTLYDVRGCTGRFPPWHDEYVSVPVENPIESALVVPVELDGVKLRAVLDSGAARTLVAAPGMARLHLGLDRLSGDPHLIVGGAGQHTVTTWQHRFSAFTVGDETMDAPTFLVSPIEVYPISDMLLGADWLLRHRIWISYATKQLFATRQGAHQGAP